MKLSVARPLMIHFDGDGRVMGWEILGFVGGKWWMVEVGEGSVEYEGACLWEEGAQDFDD